jgi:crotonobetainyl-CoA:carnitine CoA-transferase CaiB-like acyl-CoA transferase
VVDLLSALLAALVNHGSAYTRAGVVAERMGNAHPSIAPYDVYAAADGQIVLAVGNDRQFAALCEVIEAGRLSTDARFTSNAARVRHREQLRAELERRLARRAAGAWVDALSAVGVPAGCVNDIAGAFDLARRLGLDPIVELPGDGSTARLTRNPIRLSETPAQYRTAPPRLGADAFRGTERDAPCAP